MLAAEQAAQKIQATNKWGRGKLAAEQAAQKTLATTEIYTLSLHDALPILDAGLSDAAS